MQVLIKIKKTITLSRSRKALYSIAKEKTVKEEKN